MSVSQAASRGEGGHRWRAGNVAPRTWRGTLLVAIGCGWEGQAVWLSCSAAQMACSVWRPRLRSGAQVRVLVRMRARDSLCSARMQSRGECEGY